MGNLRRSLRYRRVRIGVLAVVVLAAGVVASASVGPAGATGPKQQAVTAPAAPSLSRAATNKSASAVYAYWTKARLASAKPAVAQGISTGSSAVNAGNSATGVPGTAGGDAPSSLGGLSGAPGTPPNSITGNSSVMPADGGYAGPNDTFNWIGIPRTYPVSTVGKLFFTEPGGNFVCTAATTYGGHSLDMVWTAGHCVGPQGGKSYYSNFLFCPSYSNGENPSIGCWSWAQAQQTGGWYFNGSWSADYAYLKMAAASDKVSKHVETMTGGLGFGWNWPRDQHWMDFGYPSGSPYNGSYLVVTAAEHRYDVNNPSTGDTSQDNSIGSRQTPGFSGGPWILSFGKSTNDPISHGNWINGDNSYYFTSGANGNEYGQEIQSPYYDTAACNFWKGGSGWTGTC